jgi:hypothetical protein
MLACSLVMQTPGVSWPKRARRPDKDAAGLHFIRDACKGMQITRQAPHVKTTETANSLGITNFKPGQDWHNRSMCRKRLSSTQRTSICRKIPVEFSREIVGFPAISHSIMEETMSLSIPEMYIFHEITLLTVHVQNKL